MKKILGISGILLFVLVVTSIARPNFLTAYNMQNMIRWSALFAIISIGASFVIITGGVDLSIGSVVGMTGCLLPWLLVTKGWTVASALLAVLAVAVAIGLAHGLLVTKMKLQPFVVTVCGLMIYRGLTRWFTEDQVQRFDGPYGSLRQLALGKFEIPGIGFSIPAPFFIMIVLAILAAVLLNLTIYGRYLLALGRNETAARYSGINTDRWVILAYVVCSLMSGIGGILFALDLNSIQPATHGNAYELYAIAAAVLGGCSLRGGEGSIVGVIIGAALMRTLYNAIDQLDIPIQLEYTIIGLVILGGVIADELIRRFAARSARTKAGVEEAARPNAKETEPAGT